MPSLQCQLPDGVSSGGGVRLQRGPWHWNSKGAQELSKWTCSWNVWPPVAQATLAPAPRAWTAGGGTAGGAMLSSTVLQVTSGLRTGEAVSWCWLHPFSPRVNAAEVAWPSNDNAPCHVPRVPVGVLCSAPPAPAGGWRSVLWCPVSCIAGHGAPQTALCQPAPVGVVPTTSLSVPSQSHAASVASTENRYLTTLLGTLD